MGKITRSQGIWGIAAFASIAGTALSSHAEITDARIANDGVRKFDMTLDLANSPDNTVMINGRELIIRFSAPIGDFDINTMLGKYPEQVLTVQTSYNVLLIEMAFDGEFQVTQDKSGMVVHYAPAEKPATDAVNAAQDFQDNTGATPSADTVAETRRAIIEARARMELGQYGHAREILSHIILADPDSVEARNALAEVEYRSGNWREAARQYGRVIARNHDPAIVRARQDILKQNGSFMGGGVQYQNNGSSNTQIVGTLNGRAFLRDDLLLQADFENRHIDADPFLQSDGSTADFGGERQKLALKLEQEISARTILQYRAYATQKSPGAGVEWQRNVIPGIAAIAIDYHQPYWDQTSAMVEYGTRDSLAVSYDVATVENWDIGFGTSLNRYGLNGNEDLARTVRLNGYVRDNFDIYNFPVFAGYRLDGEYPLAQEEKTAQGVTFRPLDVARREVHEFSIGHDIPLADYLTLSTGISYSYDRYGEQGFGFSGAFIGNLADEYETTLSFGHTANSSSSVGSSGSTFIGIAIKRYF
ncbi:tetratricopeptide repeat protein [Thalassospira mesophila]|uniref:Uncharacterized protein n=1 Tax=Thalassospira mesophila TaxID=1293891 RepID=A0A1Y2KXM7_9PROT|nr:tetratricopeptide repeat protein [Thalassospira mesophila]OSQ35562.1 hypothetical protein TMES_20780 [Thalassospira mesophila]